MKIYKLQRGDKFSVPQAPNIPVLTFDHMDGMYCYATTYAAISEAGTGLRSKSGGTL